MTEDTLARLKEDLRKDTDRTIIYHDQLSELVARLEAAEAAMKAAFAVPGVMVQHADLYERWLETGGR